MPRGRPKKKVKRLVPRHIAALNAERRMVIVGLTTNHSINGVAYGIREVPSEVRVPAPVARTLMESEQRKAEIDRRFLEPRDALIGLNYNGSPRVMYVQRGYFDAAVRDVLSDNAPPGLHLSGSHR